MIVHVYIVVLALCVFFTVFVSQSVLVVAALCIFFLVLALCVLVFVHLVTIMIDDGSRIASSSCCASWRSWCGIALALVVCVRVGRDR